MDGRLSTASLTPEEARARTSAAWRKESGGSAADSEAKGEVQKLDTEFNTLLLKTDQTADELRSAVAILSLHDVVDRVDAGPSAAEKYDEGYSRAGQMTAKAVQNVQNNMIHVGAVRIVEVVRDFLLIAENPASLEEQQQLQRLQTELTPALTEPLLAMLKDILPVAEQATTEMVKLELTDIENEIVTTTATAVEKISSQLTELGAKKSERDEKINDIYKDLVNTPESATAAAEAKARQDFKIHGICR